MSDTNGEISVERVRIQALDRRPVATLHRAVSRRPRIDGKFLRGPIPWDWLERAGRLPGRAFQIAVILWLKRGMRNTATVTLGRAELEGMEIKRHAVYRALDQLENAGLVEVDRRHGRRALITIIDEQKPTRFLAPSPTLQGEVVEFKGV